MKGGRRVFVTIVMKNEGLVKCRNAKLFILEGIELVHGENSSVRITELDEEVDSEVVHKIDRSVQSN